MILTCKQVTLKHVTLNAPNVSPYIGDPIALSLFYRQSTVMRRFFRI